MRSMHAWMLSLGTLLQACVPNHAALAANGPLEIRRVSPSGTEVTPAQEVVIQFDRAMVPLGHMGRKTSELPASIHPDP